VTRTPVGNFAILSAGPAVTRRGWPVDQGITLLSRISMNEGIAQSLSALSYSANSIDILRFSLPAMVQEARMYIEAFEDFYFNVCTMDYSKMQNACEPLRELMEKTDHVRITGPGIDLKFPFLK
jgi:leucyl aminopeptidase (aminopeptidase T)